MNKSEIRVNPLWTTLVCKICSNNDLNKTYKLNMSTESLNRTSEIVETPSQYVETPKRVNVDVLKQRLLEEKKKEKVKRTIILSSVIVSLGALTMLTY